jgi:hypothetical protein
MAFLRSNGRGALRRLARCLLMLALLGAADARAAAPSREYQLKAIFLFNFSQFVAWPSGSLGGGQSPFVVGVLGDDPFGDYLDATVVGERVGTHPMVVRRYGSVDDIGDCQVLFISGSEAGRLGRIIARLGGRKILTVGDTEGFCRMGGMVRFVTEQGRIRLRIDVEAARSAGLTISSKLLRAAAIVTREDD